MFSFWPSLSLLVFFLVIFLECRAIAGRVTLPLGSFLMVFCYGSIGAPLLALLLQQVPIFPDAGPASPATWLLGPPIEELAKALPVIVLAFLTRESRRLSIADLTLIGFASGAGFGFVEGNLNALVNGTLPSVQHLVALGLQTENGVVFFAGHAVTTALVGLAAGIGLRFLPPNIAYAWAPAAFAILWTSFDHGIYNWKVLNAADGALPSAHVAVELLHELTLKGQLATWFLPIGLIAAQLIEAYLCSQAVGVRRDLLLAREWRPWVANELLVALMRLPLGRAVFSETLAYFRLRRAFYLAAFETRRDPKDPTLSRHARSLEDRLKRERAILFDPAPGTWLLPTVVLKAYALQWAWRMRWVLVFAVLVLLLFMLDPRSLPEGMRQVLFGDVFTVIVAIAGLAFAVWRIILFGRVPPPDPLAAEGTAFASHYTRQLLLGCSLACGLFPSLAVLLGWKALAPGAAFIGGYLPGWIAQGGNLQTLLGLGAIGGAVAPDPRPAGEAFRHEIAAGEERIRRLGSEIEGANSLQLQSFLDAMAKLDAERDAQARRQLILDGCERQASEATIRDPAPVVQAIKDEFDRLAGELLEAAAKDLDAMSSLEQDYARVWSQIMQDLDTHDALRRGLRTPLREAWQAQNDIGWALRVVQATDDGLLPAQLTILPELREIANAAVTARSEIVAAGVERIRATAAEYGESDPFAFTGAAPVEDEAALLAKFAPSAPSAEEPKPFGLRAPHPGDALAPATDDGADVAKDEPLQPAATPASSRGQHYQEALDQLIESAKRDTGYLETIRHLERSDEALSAATPAPLSEDSSAGTTSGEHQDELEDLIDAIKRDSGYLAFAKDAPVTRGKGRSPAKSADAPVTQTSDDAGKIAQSEPPAKAETRTSSERPATPSTTEQEEQERAAFAHRPAPVIAASVDAPAAPQAEQGASQAIDSEWAIAAAAYKQAQEKSETAAAQEAEPAEAKAPVAHAPEAAIEVPEPKETDAPASPARPIELAQVAAPAAAPEIAPPAEAEPAQAEAVTAHAKPVEHAPTETPSIAVEIATPAEPAPAQAEALIALAEPVKRAEIEAPAPVLETNTPEIAKPTEPEASADPAQSEAPTAPVEPVERTEIGALAARFAPEARKPELVEPPSRTETRASFFARLFEAAMRQPSDSKATPASKDQSHDVEPKPESGQSPEAPIARQAVDPTVKKHDTEPQKPSDEISAPISEWLADFTTLNADSAKAQTDDTSLEKIEWPSLSQTTRAEAPADKSVSASIPGDVAELLETVSDASAQTEADRAPITHEAVGSVAPIVEPAQQVESAPLAETLTDVEKPGRPATAAADAAPDDKTVKPAKPEGGDEFASKVDRLSYLLEKLERAMQAAPATQAAPAAQAEPAPQAEPPSAKPAEVVEVSGAHVQANEPAIVVESELAKTQPPAEEPTQPEKPSERPAMPVEEPAIAPEPTTVATEQAIAPQPPAEEPKAVAEAVSASAPAEPQSPSDAQKSDRLSYLLTKLFETVKQDSARKPAAPEQVEEKPASEEITPPAPTTPDHPVASEVLDLRGPHPIAEPLEPAHVASEPPPQELERAKVEAQPEPAAQADAPVVEPPAPTDAIVLPKREDAKPAEVSQAELPADASEAPRPAAEQSVQAKIRSRSSARATHFGSRKSQRSSAPAPLENGEAKPSTKLEAEPDPIAPPAQAHAAVVDQPVPTGEAAWAPSDEGKPADAAPPAAPAEPFEASPVAEQPSEQPVQPKTISRSPAPTTTFGSRKSPHASTPAPLADGEAKPSASKRPKESVEAETPSTTPKRDWKLGSAGPAGAETLKPRDQEAAKRSEPSFRVKTGSGALATVDTAPTVLSPAATAATPAKYYGPRHVGASDGEADTHAQQRAVSLADALTDFYTRVGTPQPAMYTTDRATLHRIIASGKLDAPRRRGAPWSISGTSRRGEIAIRLKPGSESHIEFVPSTEIFGQVPHYYPRGVGKGSYQTHVPAEYLEYFDVAARQWAPLRG